MSLWNRAFLKFTLIEWLVALVVLLILARFIWAEEVAAFEDRLFASVGLGVGAKYLVLLPLGVWVYFRLFKSEHAIAEGQGKKVVRPWVLVVSAASLVVAVIILLVSTLS